MVTSLIRPNLGTEFEKLGFHSSMVTTRELIVMGLNLNPLVPICQSVMGSINMHMLRIEQFSMFATRSKFVI